jgi:MFS family permease
VFFAGGLLQAVSALLATPIAARIGLVSTMVFTQIAANLLIIGVAFAAFPPLALGCLLLRYLLSQIDIPARQAFVIGSFAPAERTAAAAFTNSSRYFMRPIAPLAAGALMQVALAAPFVAAAAIKLFYDLAFYALYRKSEVEGDHRGSLPAVPAADVVTPS